MSQAQPRMRPFSRTQRPCGTDRAGRRMMARRQGLRHGACGDSPTARWNRRPEGGVSRGTEQGLDEDRPRRAPTGTTVLPMGGTPKTDDWPVQTAAGP